MLLNYLRKNLNIFILIGIVSLGCLERTEAKLQPDEEATIKVFEETSPSVAFIKNAALQWDWFSTYVYEIPQGAGSGFIWDKVENNDSLVDYVDNNKDIGDKINLRFTRDQKEYGTTAILQELRN